MSLNEEIQKQRQELYLYSLKVATETLKEAEGDGYEVSSSLLSASSSLLKLDIDKIIEDKSLENIHSKITELIEPKEKKPTNPHYKEG